MPAIRQRTRADQRREQQRLLLFPNVSPEDLWKHENNGWCWVPRTMPLIMHAIRSLSKGSSAAETYFALWCHCVSESLVEMGNKASLISAAGYTGATNERTWRKRMKRLEELGFVKIASGKHGDISCVLILNPHKVLRHHKQLGTPGFDQKIYNCILEEMADYRMRDFEQPTPEQPKVPTPETVSVPPPPPPANAPILVRKR